VTDQRHIVAERYIAYRERSMNRGATLLTFRRLSEVIGLHDYQPDLTRSIAGTDAHPRLALCLLSRAGHQWPIIVAHCRPSEWRRPRVLVALTDLLTSANVARFRRQSVAERASLRPEDDDQPVGDGWYDKKLDRKVRRLNDAVDGRYTVGEFIAGLLGAIGDALSGM